MPVNRGEPSALTRLIIYKKSRRFLLGSSRAGLWSVLVLLAFLTGCSSLGEMLSSGSPDEDHPDQLAELTSEVDVIKADVFQLKSDVAEIKKNLAGPSPETMGQTRSVPTKSPAVKKEYDQARRLYVSGKYEDAAAVFTRIAGQAPNDVLAPNALYWLGECHYSRRRFKEAITEFDRVVKQYPQSDKAPDAMLKIAYSRHLLDDDQAIDSLNELLTRWPKSRAAGMVKKGQTLFK